MREAAVVVCLTAAVIGLITLLAVWDLAASGRAGESVSVFISGASIVALLWAMAHSMYKLR